MAGSGGFRRVWLDRSGAFVSAGVHAAVLACLLGGFHWGPRVAAYKLPGIANGVRTLTYFSAGNPQPHAADEPVKAAEAAKQPVETAVHSMEAKAASAPAVQADAGAGTSVKSGVGEGNIDIALQKYFPYPKPDLSTMKRGTEGDVILDAVIDEHGKIASLTVVHGLGDAIDKTVLATVEQWSYTPAMKDGVAVPSEQELRFHYQRG
jgi:protein TonB